MDALISLPTTSLAVLVRHHPRVSPISQISWPVKNCDPTIDKGHQPLIHSILDTNDHNVTKVKSPRNHLPYDCLIDSMHRRGDDGIVNGENEVGGD
jgi:hypothetical protein